MNRRLILSILLFLPLLALFLFWSALSSFFQYGLLVVAIFSVLLALAVLSSSISRVSQQEQAVSPLPSRTLTGTSTTLLPKPVLPSIPCSAAEAYKSLNPVTFEYFSAAVIIGEGHGHRFVQRCGGSNDQGVDVRLLNQVNLPVIVQCKHFAPGNTVGPIALRDFVGTIQIQHAMYGYFVTTSTLSAAARKVVSHPQSRIHLIDGRKLDGLLQVRNREIAQAYQEICSLK